MRSLAIPLGLCLAILVPIAGRSETARPWSGRINGYDAYVPDLNQPIRAAAINNGVPWLPDSDPDWRAVAMQFNCIQLDIPLDYSAPDISADRIIATLNIAAKDIAGHAEIQYVPVILFGFSAGSAAAAITASSPKLSNPDPEKPPQRVLAVVALHEISRPPYLPPLSTPHLVLSDPGDKYSGLLTNVEDLTPAISHDAFARNRAAEGAPLTLISQPGHWHGGSIFGLHNKVDYKFARVWLEEVLKLRLPAEAPTNAPAMMSNWRHHPGWLGAYDVVINANTQPWGNQERMSNVAISPRASYGDRRPYIWLPSEYCAKVWRTYASTGSMPSLTPEQPTVAVNAFARTYRAAFFTLLARSFGERRLQKLSPIFGERLKPTRDQPMRVVAGAKPALGSTPDRCRFGPFGPFGPSGERSLIVTFDRAIVAGQAAIGAGSAALRGAPIFWSNTMTINLANVAKAQTLQVVLSNITPADGGPPIEATVTSLCP
ncbi:hypothetical protein [Methylocapsa aurea]|uniref:hypothetical protein n=1 Tax=Methylocapsa aurea TaxID=663610 RepID=UPI0012EBF624|nr:hypothetical protein [Methylocapsa aurea]